jgi:hypothetical protein
MPKKTPEVVDNLDGGEIGDIGEITIDSVTETNVDTGDVVRMVHHITGSVVHCPERLVSAMMTSGFRTAEDSASR